LTRTARILLIDSDPWRAESLMAFLLREKHAAERAPSATTDPEVVLVNLFDQTGELRARVEKLRAAYPNAKILAFVREVDTQTVFPCLLLGVKGVLPYDAAQKEIQAAIACVVEGSIWTPRPVLAQWIDRIATLGLATATDRTFTRSEQRVLEGVREELSNKEIASNLGVTEATVKFHVGKLLRKTGTKDRHELARFVRETVSSFSASEK